MFDKILIEEAAKQGVEVRFGHGVTAFDNSGDFARLNIETDTGESYELTAKFVLDASGYGRVLPRLLNLKRPRTCRRAKRISRTSTTTLPTRNSTATKS